jgi:hypothetical protein
MPPTRPQLPNKRWLTRAMVIEFCGSWRELVRLEHEGKLTRVYPGGIKHARYVRAEVLAAVEEK